MHSPSNQPLNLSYAPQGGERELLPTRENVVLLQDALHYAELRRQLRREAVSVVILGPIFIGLGAFSLTASPLLGLPLLLMGVALLSAGGWSWINPSPRASLFAGIGLLIYGLVGMGASFMPQNLYLSPANFTPWIARGVLNGSFGSAFAPGLFLLWRYRRFVQVKRTVPSRATLNWLDQLVRSTTGRNPSDDAAIIQFEDYFWSLGHISPGSAQLGPEIILFVLRGPHSLPLLASKDSVAIISEKLLRDGQRRKVCLQVNGRTLRVVMRDLSLGRLEAWLATTSAPVLSGPVPAT